MLLKKTWALAVILALLGVGVIHPAAATVTPATSCTTSPSSATIASGDAPLDVTLSWTGQPSGRIYYWWQYDIDGVNQGFDSAWYEDGPSGSYVVDTYTWQLARAGKTVVTRWLPILSDMSGPSSATPLCQVSITYAPAASSNYSVTVNPGTNGTAIASPATVSSGGSSTLTATPNAGYVLSAWNCTGGGTFATVSSTSAILTNITSNATCAPTFQPAPTTKNFGHSDKTTDPDRDRKNFSPAPKK